jgi:hypothetical protein
MKRTKINVTALFIISSASAHFYRKFKTVYDIHYPTKNTNTTVEQNLNVSQIITRYNVLRSKGIASTVGEWRQPHNEVLFYNLHYLPKNSTVTKSKMITEATYVPHMRKHNIHSKLWMESQGRKKPLGNCFTSHEYNPKLVNNMLWSDKTVFHIAGFDNHQYSHYAEIMSHRKCSLVKL